MGSTGSAGTPAWCHGGPTPPRRSGALDGGRGAAPAVAVPRGHAPRRRRADDGQVALAVGPVHAHPGPRQPGQQPLGRVPVGVVRPHRDQRHAGAAGREEGRIGVRAAVVRNLQHVGAAGRSRTARIRASASALRSPVNRIRTPRCGDPDDHRQVVGLRGGGGPLRVGGEHLDRRRCRPSAGPRARGPCARRRCRRTRRSNAAARSSEGASVPVATTPTVAAGERPGEPSRVIGVQVRHQDEREGVDPEPVQAAVDRPDVRPGVDQDAGPGPGGHDEARRPARRRRR